MKLLSAARVLLCTYGTRGDVEPFLALAKGLQAAGVVAALVTSVRFRERVDGFGVPFLGVSDASLALVDSPPPCGAFPIEARDQALDAGAREDQSGTMRWV